MDAITAGNPMRRFTDLGLAAGVATILAILFLPIPAILVDFGLAVSLSLSVLILMVALWIDRPLSFSAFPTILLIATMLRLSLNIATTRMILSDGHEGVTAAGHVIAGFSSFIMGGDFLIGLVIFLILVVVNFVVISKGSTRIAEVGARFTLDAIPGKQMSIDADLSAGIISEKEAQFRRRELEEESAFFGSMDGASKFVRGDAVAGLIITGINILGGILLGYSRHGMNFSEAADVFTKLSVGDGLVSQIPALIVSLAAGLLVSKGGVRGSADIALFQQLGAYPKALYVAALLLLTLGVMPGLPFLPFALLSIAFAGYGFHQARRVIARETKKTEEEFAAVQQQQEEENRSVKSSLDLDEIELVLGKQLAVSLVSERSELSFRMNRIRKRFASEYGFVIPEVKIDEDLSIDGKSYQIRVHGTVVASYSLRLGEILVFAKKEKLGAIPGEPVKEPAFGMDAFSVPSGFADELKGRNLPTADAVGVMLTHLTEVIRNNLPQLLSYKAVRSLIGRLDPDYRKLAEEICTNHITYPGFQAVLKSLLAERVSIRNLQMVLEAVAELSPHTRRTERLVEHVRLRMSQQICGELAENGTLRVVRLGSRWDLAFQEALKRDNNGEVRDFDMDPVQLEKFGLEAKKYLQTQFETSKKFVILTSPEARPYVRMIIERLFPSLSIISHVEIARGMQVDIVGTIG